MAEFQELAQAQATDPFASTLSKIDRQLTIHDAYDKSQSYLGTAFDLVWRQDENSLNRLKGVREKVEDARKTNDVGALEKMQAEVQKQLEKDSKAVKLQSDINHYGGTTAKVASIFVAGPVGWTAAGALYALDSARPADKWQYQAIDATLGAASGLALKGVFGAARTWQAPFYAKGVGMGVASRLIDNTLNRHTYINPGSGAVDMLYGGEQIVKNTLSPTALATDVAVFAIGYGLGAGLQKLEPGLMQNRVFSQLAGAGTWGASSGGVREAVRQVTAKETINLGKIGFHSALGAGLFTLAALPGTLQAEHEYQKMVAAQNTAGDGTDGHGHHSTDGSDHHGQLVEYKKVGTVRAEQLTKPQDWTTSKGDQMHGDAGDWKITGPDGSTWTVKPDVFAQTYSPVAGGQGTFAKTAITRATQLTKPTEIQTLEGKGTGDTGDYLVTGPKGEQYIVPKAKFESMYVRVTPDVVDVTADKLGAFKKVGTIQAEQLKADQEWTTSKGDVMKGAAGDWKVTGPDGSTWTVKPDIFAETYSAVSGGAAGTFAKTAITRAIQLDRSVVIKTLEGTGTGDKGDYLVVGPKGEQYIVPKAKFESSYQRFEVKPSVVPVAGQADPAEHGEVVGYRKMGSVRAELMEKPQEWQTTTGNTMKGEAGDYKITGADGSIWTIKGDIFKETYAPVAGEPGQFAKSVVTRAVVLAKPTTIQTLEGEGSGNPGDYLVIGAKGEQYIVSKATFESMYKPEKPQ